MHPHATTTRSIGCLDPCVDHVIDKLENKAHTPREYRHPVHGLLDLECGIPTDMRDDCQLIRERELHGHVPRITARILHLERQGHVHTHHTRDAAHQTDHGRRRQGGH